MEKIVTIDALGTVRCILFDERFTIVVRTLYAFRESCYVPIESVSSILPTQDVGSTSLPPFGSERCSSM